MHLDDLIFLDNLPKLDLHGYDQDTACVLINDFIKENYKLKQPFLVIIHGIGSGTLRKATAEVLRKNRNVIEFKTYYYNNGCTVVQIKIAD